MVPVLTKNVATRRSRSSMLRSTNAIFQKTKEVLKLQFLGRQNVGKLAFTNTGQVAGNVYCCCIAHYHYSEPFFPLLRMQDFSFFGSFMCFIAMPNTYGVNVFEMG